ncbi:MAG: hypothetical protein SOZ59_15735 [Candidatus Limivivens sp.]|nr:hypothetical protein [Candidatus Limivivens sp.]
MRKTGILRLCFLVCVCAVFFGMNVSAAGTVAKIGSKKYSSLQAAVNKVKQGQTIKLQKDLKVQPKTLRDSVFTVNRKVSFTLDLNKHTLTCVGTYARIYINKGFVTIKNGTMKRVNNSRYSGGGQIFVEKGAKLEIKSGTYRNMEVINNGGTVNISGGTYLLTENFGFTNAGGKMTFSGAKVTSSSVCDAIANQESWDDQKSVLYIKSGTFTTTRKSNTGGNRFLSNKGTVVITGGTFTSTKGTCLLANGGTMTIKKVTCINSGGGSCIACYNGNYAKLTIEGGTFTSYHKGGLTDSDLTVYGCGTVNISGGRFTAYGGPNKGSVDWSPPYALGCSSGTKLTITGGKFLCPNKPAGWANVRLYSGCTDVKCTVDSVIML